jgi:hypothetical protein
MPVVIEKPYNMDDDGRALLVGAKYKSFTDLECALKNIQWDNYVQLYKRSSRKLGKIGVHVRKPVDHLVTTSARRTCRTLTRIIQSLYYAPAGRYINVWMHSLKKSVKPEIVNRYD